MSYDQLLRDPRWRLKRKVIIERDNKQCTVCGGKKKLVVHHTFYYKDKINPWQYPDDSLLTLCETCHKEYHTYNELTFKDNPIKGKNKKKKKEIKKTLDKPKKKGKSKNRKHNRIPRICLAEIQAHPDQFIKDQEGTWKRKPYIKY
jgi:5-methylcytosine-specific restriction endonuclease McrA